MSLTALGVSFAYPRCEALFRDVSLDVQRGASVAVMAPSGTGKTTLLSILGGLRAPSSGSVVVRADEEPGGASEPDRPRQPTRPSGRRHGETAWVFQHMHLLPRRTVLDNVAVAALARGARRRLAERRALEELGRFGLDGFGGRALRELSGGEQQRVALARAAAGDPTVVLADEPTANLDRSTAQVVTAVLFSGFPRAALVVVTHDAEVARAAGAAFVLAPNGLRPLVIG